MVHHLFTDPLGLHTFKKAPPPAPAPPKVPSVPDPVVTVPITLVDYTSVQPIGFMQPSPYYINYPSGYYYPYQPMVAVGAPAPSPAPAQKPK